MKVTHCPPAYDPSLEYDSHIFKKEVGHRDLFGIVDYSDANRMQFFEAKIGTKDVPVWIRDTRKLQEVLYGHPQADRLAPKWAKILYLYYFLFYTAEDVAENMGLTAKAVRRTIDKLNLRAAKGE